MEVILKIRIFLDIQVLHVTATSMHETNVA